MKFWIGVAHFSLHLYDAVSLKDRRQVVRSLSERVKRHFNLSTADLGPDGVWNEADLAVTCCGSSHREMEQRMDQIVSFMERTEEEGAFEMLSAHREVFSYGDV